jgi:hypothetical protein
MGWRCNNDYLLFGCGQDNMEVEYPVTCFFCKFQVSNATRAFVREVLEPPGLLVREVSICLGRVHFDLGELDGLASVIGYCDVWCLGVSVIVSRSQGWTEDLRHKELGMKSRRYRQRPR